MEHCALRWDLLRLALQGTITVEAKDRAQWHGAMRAEAKDRKLGGGVRARLGMDLLDKGAAETEMRVTLEAHVLGKIGEFGQPVMRKRADAMLQDFAHQVSERLAGHGHKDALGLREFQCLTHIGQEGGRGERLLEKQVLPIGDTIGSEIADDAFEIQYLRLQQRLAAERHELPCQHRP